jgi:hypothetical protein
VREAQNSAPTSDLKQDPKTDKPECFLIRKECALDQLLSQSQLSIRLTVPSVRHSQGQHHPLDLFDLLPAFRPIY